MRRLVQACGVLAAVFCLSGCATAPYRYGQPGIESPRTYRLAEGESQIVRGRPNAFLDNVSGWVWPDSLLGKLVLWNIRVDNHKISARTEAMLQGYLRTNHLDNVKVRLNQYAPGQELRRTVRNRAMGPVWRYSFGMVAWIQYTAMPGRFFGGDHFNPYSNTINLYSDVPAIALHEAGHSKDFASKCAKGPYALLYMAPFANLWHESRATSDALGYLMENAELRDRRSGYNVLYPAYGTYIASDVTGFQFPPLPLLMGVSSLGLADWQFGPVPFPWNYAVMGGTVLTAHAVARIKSLTLREGVREGVRTSQEGIAPAAPPSPDGTGGGGGGRADGKDGSSETGKERRADP